MTRIAKKDIYLAHGITYIGDKILSPIGLINPLLCNGNDKLGLNVWTFSTLAGNIEYTANVNGEQITVKGTCNCNCDGCYAQCGRYNMANVKDANARKTVLIRDAVDFVASAIKAQIAADKIKLCRIHASGDFDSGNAAYIAAWHNIVSESPDTTFWTYTKDHGAEHAFDDLSNINVVPSIIPNIGINFGHCDYILDAYRTLCARGESVHICRCGFDKQQHCNTCDGCTKHRYVLFVEHSTDYIAEIDPCFETLKAIAMQQHSD